MKREQTILLTAGLVMGLFLGYLLGKTIAKREWMLAHPLTGQEGMPGQGAEGFDLAQHQQDFKKMIEQAEARPDDPMPRVALGNAYMDGGRYEDAIHWYDEALKLDPDNAEVWVDKGICLRDLHKPQEAEAAFRKGMELNGSLVQPYLNMAVLRIDENDLDGALKWLKEAEVKFPQEPKVAQAIGMTWLQKSDFPKALASFQKAMEIAPEDAMVARTNGMILVEKKRGPDALPFLERALQLEPHDTEVKLTLVRIYGMELKQTEKALTLLSEVEKEMPGDELLADLRKRLEARAAGTPMAPPPGAAGGGG